MVLESEYIGGGGGREGTDRNEGGNLLDGPVGKEGVAVAGNSFRLRLCGQPGPAAGGLLPRRQAPLTRAA